jgi:hypothetical protein
MGINLSRHGAVFRRVAKLPVTPIRIRSVGLTSASHDDDGHVLEAAQARDGVAQAQAPAVRRRVARGHHHHRVEPPRELQHTRERKLKFVSVCGQQLTRNGKLSFPPRHPPASAAAAVAAAAAVWAPELHWAAPSVGKDEMRNAAGAGRGDLAP